MTALVEWTAVRSSPVSQCVRVLPARASLAS
jgi:hypothetical protein